MHKCVCVRVCARARPDGFPALNQSAVIISSARKAPMGTSAEKAICAISTKDSNIRITLLSQTVTDACGQQSCPQLASTNLQHQTHTNTRSHDCWVREGLQYFPASARLDKIKLFPFPGASFLLSNAGFSNNTRFIVGRALCPQISNSCQMRCDRMRRLFSHSAGGGPRWPLTLAGAKPFMSPIQQLHRPASVNTTVSF